MRYCDFINQTISRENGIDWNYYRNDIATTDIFCSEVKRKSLSVCISMVLNVFVS